MIDSQGRILLHNTDLGQAPKGKPGYITKVHHAVSAVMVHWESEESDEEAGW